MRGIVRGRTARRTHVTTALLLAFAFARPLPASAHDGPAEVISALTAEIEREGPSAIRYYLRGSEYAALRNHVAAEADFRRSLALKADFRTTQALVRTLVSQGSLREAGRISADERARRSTDERYAAEAAALEAEVHLAAGRWEPAVERLNDALARRADLDWFLLRSRAQARLQRHADRVAGLREAVSRLAGPVLEAELCDAWIAQSSAAATPEEVDAAATAALLVIEANLQANRYVSAWLIRRARVSLKRGRQAAAQSDLCQAIAELDDRIRPDRPDVTLVAERAIANLLLGREAEARKDFLLARKHRAPAWTLEPLIDHFGDLPPPPTAVTD